jgi:hypothetical protein
MQVNFQGILSLKKEKRKENKKHSSKFVKEGGHPMKGH